MHTYCILYFHKSLDHFHYVSRNVCSGVLESCMENRWNRGIGDSYLNVEEYHTIECDCVKPILSFNHSIS